MEKSRQDNFKIVEGKPIKEIETTTLTYYNYEYLDFNRCEIILSEKFTKE
jgi:hypothetical protein